MKINDNKVLQLFSEGYSVSKIAKLTGLSRQGIYNILNRNKVNYKKSLKTIELCALENKLKETSINNIIRETGIPYHRIKRIMAENELQKSEIMKDILRVSDVERLYNKYSFTDEQIGNIFRCSQYTVRSFRWKHNIYDVNRKWQERLTKDVYCDLRKNGCSLSEIAKKTGIPYYTVVKAKKMYE